MIGALTMREMLQSHVVSLPRGQLNFSPWRHGPQTVHGPLLLDGVFVDSMFGPVVFVNRKLLWHCIPRRSEERLGSYGQDLPSLDGSRATSLNNAGF